MESEISQRICKLEDLMIEYSIAANHHASHIVQYLEITTIMTVITVLQRRAFQETPKKHFHAIPRFRLLLSPLCGMHALCNCSPP